MRERIASLLLLALFMRALVPAGFMLAPSQGESHNLTVVICTVHGSQAITVDEDGNPKRPNASHDTCPFAASALPGIVSEPAGLVAEVKYAAVTYTLTRLQFTLTPRPSATSARGPPRLV
jgi:hypothetical protein